MAAITTTTSAAPARRAARSATGVRVSSIRDPAGEDAWAAYVHQSAEGTLFHLPLWCRAVERAFGHRAAHLMARRGTEVVGVLPLMEVRSWLAGKLLVSVPYATYGGLLYEDEEARDALARAAVELVHRSGARALDLRSQRAAVPAFERDERYAGFAKQLPQSPDGLETFLPRKARAAARLAREREHLTVRHDPKHLRLVWRLYTRSMRRLASINYPLRFFTALAAELGPRAWVTTVWRGERPIAGLLSFVYRDIVLPYFVGVDERVRAPGAMNLIYLAVMERAVHHGLRRFDFGRSRVSNRGPYEFKKNQGFAPRPLGYQRFVPEGASAPNLSPDNARFRAARRVWPHLPLAITQRFGAWLAGSIPG